MCEKVYDGVKSLTAQISALCEKPDVDPNGMYLGHLSAGVASLYEAVACLSPYT